MKAIVLTVGNEILLGETIDTNMAALGRALTAAGAEIVGHLTVGDRTEVIAAAVRDAAARADLVIVTGGLGPTPDDVTREGVALAFGLALHVDEAAAQAIRERFRRAGRTMAEVNVRQAEMPDGAVALPNPVGMAPGIRLLAGSATIYILPGVPSEMRAILEGSVLPEIRARSDANPPLVRVIRTAGVPESEIAERLSFLQQAPGLTLAFLPDPLFGVDLRFLFHSEDAAACEALIGKARAVLGEAVYADGSATLEAVVGEALRAAGRTLAAAESCTGGLIAKRITDVAGSSDYFLGGVVTYSNASKVRDLGVPEGLIGTHGAVSEPVVRAMAEGARSRFGAHYALAATGIAGPGGGSAEKPVGLVWLGLAAPGGTQARRLQLPGDRGWVRERTAQVALDWLRREIVRGA